MPQDPTYTVDGGKIRARRMARGMETTQLAALAVISRRYLSHLENGTRTNMRPAPYHRLCSALGATVEQLLAPGQETPDKE